MTTATPAAAAAAPVAAPVAPSASATVSTANAPVVPASSAVSANTSAPSATTGAPLTPAADWTTGLPDATRGFVSNKGWKNPGEVLDSYQNLEKLVGAPQDKIIKMPADDDKAGWDSVYSRLGRPQTPAEYKIEAAKEGGDPAFAKWAGENFHELGLSTKQGQALANKFNEYMAGAKSAQDNAMIQKLQEGQDGLKKEWGAAYDQRIKEASRAAREFGFTKDEIDALESKIGFDGVMKRFQSLGSKIGESSFHTGETGNGMLTPDQARDKISALKQDRDFIRKYASGDLSSRKEMERLHQMAYQGEHTV